MQAFQEASEESQTIFFPSCQTITPADLKI